MELPVKTYDADVTGGTLRVLSWGHGPRPVLAVHGITANATCWQAVARALPDDCTLYAVDLRGRGHSAALPGPYGFDQHLADLTGEPGQLRSRVAAESVRTDGRELLSSGERLAAALGRLAGPTPLLRAPAGMFGQPPGMIPAELAAHRQASTPALRVQTIPETNHYTILFSPSATAAIAAQLSPAERPDPAATGAPE